jgi:hypothetical protein
VEDRNRDFDVLERAGIAALQGHRRGSTAKPSNFAEVLEADEEIRRRVRPGFFAYVRQVTGRVLGALPLVAYLIFGPPPGEAVATFWPFWIVVVLVAFLAYSIVTELLAYRGTEYVLTDRRLLLRKIDERYRFYRCVEAVTPTDLRAIERGPRGGIRLHLSDRVETMFGVRYADDFAAEIRRVLDPRHREAEDYRRTES